MASGLNKMNIAFTGMCLSMIARLNSSYFEPSPHFEFKECQTDLWSFNIKGEVLYWKGELEGLQTAFGDTTIETTVSTDAITTTTILERDTLPSFQWQAGYRIGADLFFHCIDIEIDWTHFDGRAKFHDNLQYGHWKIQYNTFDFIVGRYWQAAPCLFFKPFLGLRYANIRQSLHSNLTTLYTGLNGSQTVYSDKYDKENLWGVGPQVGIEADWYIGWDITAYASFDMVNYYGHVKGTNYDVDTFTTNVSVSDGQTKHHFNNFGTDGAIGLRWVKSLCICDIPVNFLLEAGVEQHRIYDFSELGSDGALSLDGPTFGAGIGFCF